jgi:hypothetical protein
MSEAPQTSEPVRVETSRRDTVPAGTEFAISVDSTIETKQPTEGMTYPAHFAQAIVDQNGTTIVPSGSPAQLVVVDAEEGGTLKSPTLTLGIQSVTVDGRRYAVTTATREEKGEGIGANKRTGIFVGGGAVLGTALGAIVGGTKGAIIGGVLGGAAGAATQVITRGKEVKVPAGTVLTFRLDDPWRLRPDSGYDRPIS